jgi:hypothetical protein
MDSTGMTTVLIAGETIVEEAVTGTETAAVVDAVVSALTEAELRKALPQLWPSMHSVNSMLYAFRDYFLPDISSPPSYQ